MSADLPDGPRSDEPAESASRAGRWILRLLQPKVAIPLIVVLLLAAAPLIYRANRISRVPPAAEPFDTQSVLEFIVSDEDNAFVEYRAAHVLYVEYAGIPGDPQQSSDEFEKSQSDGWEHATEPVRKWLDANRPFMELWKKGTAKPDAQYYRASEYGIDTLLGAVDDARQFARLARLESSRLLAERKPDEAWEWLRTGFRMSRHVGRRGCLIERFVGVAMHSISASGMVEWVKDSSVTANQLRQAMKELREEQKRVGLISDNLKIEYLSMMSSFFADTSPVGIGPIRFPDSPWLDHAYLFFNGEPELSQQVAGYVFANWLSQADKPRSQRTKQAQNLGLFEPDPTILAPQPRTSELDQYIRESILAKLLLPAGNYLFVAMDREAERDRVLLAVFALELFSREHGHYPEKLEELVPDFLPAVPEDTHAPPKTPLRYRRDGDGALIYSVGENGTDDGGVFEKVEDIGYRIGKPREKTQE